MTGDVEFDLAVGPKAIDAYSRLSYSMWHALAEFIDNSTQSRLNYDSIIDGILAQENSPLEVKIIHNRPNKTLEIHDNSIGMTFEDLREALRVAHPTKDSKGRSKYGMGMKTAACWIGRKWKIVTTEWGSGEECTAEIDVDAIANKGAKIRITRKTLETTDQHYTKIIISELRRNIQKRTEETIRGYLGSMYRFDLQDGRLKIVYNNEEIKAPDEYKFDTDPQGKAFFRQIPETLINGKKIAGWFGILSEGSGGRKYGGFSLFQNKRQIQGFPQAWKPKSIFGGVDDEGANNLIAQRLTGLIELDGFEVSHTKDAILFQDDEEEELEKFLSELTKDFRDYAAKRRSVGTKGQPWSRDKVRELLDAAKGEFSNPEMKDAVNNSVLPPLSTILANNKQQLASVKEDDKIATFDITPNLRLIVDWKEASEYEPYATIVAGAEAGTIHIIINGLHPYLCDLEATDEIDECLRQFVYDAIAEYRVSKQESKVTPASVWRMKDNLLRVNALRIKNAALLKQEGSFETTFGENNETEEG